MMLNLSQIFASGQNQGSKSNVIKPLLFISGVILIGLIFAIKYEAPNIVTNSLIVFFGISFAALLFAYFYCLVKNPNLLRSEHYNIEQSIIQKTSFIGESINPSLNGKMQNRGINLRSSSSENDITMIDEANQGGDQ